MLQQPSEVRFERIEGEEEDVLAVFGHKLDCARIPASNEIHIMSVGSLVGGDTHGEHQTWNMYSGQCDTFTDVPHCRWDHDVYYSSDINLGLAVCKHGSFVEINAMCQFDPAFFGLSMETANTLIHNDMKFLEIGYETLHSGGHTKQSLKNAELMLVFGEIGRDANFMKNILLKGANSMHGFGDLHLSTHLFAKVFGTKGPSFMVDTACSATTTGSNLIHQEMKRNRDAIQEKCRPNSNIFEGLSAGMNLLDDPGPFIGMSQARMLGWTGRCLTFDMSAGGYARGENCAAAYLKLCSDTTAASFQKAAILGTMINQDGRSASLTAPNGPSQTLCIRGALRDAKSDPIEVSFCEMHGTGTALGDPIEVGSMRTVMSVRGNAALPLPNNSGKTMTGHCEIGAGLNSQIRTLLSLERCCVPSNCHLGEFNHHIEEIGYPALWVNENTRLEKENNQAGLSSFGFGGTNTRMELWVSGRARYHGKEAPRLTTSAAGTALALLAYPVQKDKLNFERVGRILVSCPRCLGQMCLHCREAHSDVVDFEVHQCQVIREESATYEHCSNCYMGGYMHGVATAGTGSRGGKVYLFASWSGNNEHEESGFLEMKEGADKDGDATYSTTVTLGASLQEHFHILLNKDAKLAMYPVSEDENQYSDIAGPNGNASGNGWIIDGVSDNMPAGAVYKVTFTWSYDRKHIEWRPISDTGLLMVSNGNEL